MRYISLGEVMELKCCEGLDANIVQRIIEEIEGVVDEYCNTSFVPVDFVQISLHKSRIHLIKRPVLDVLSVSNSGVLTEMIDYTIDTLNGVITLLNGFKSGVYEITYQYGYKAVPATVKNVIKDLIRLELLKDDANSLMLSETFDGEYSYTRKDSISKEYKDILSRLDMFRVDEVDTLTDDRIKVAVRWF